MASDDLVKLVEFDDDALPAALKWQVLSFLRIVWPEGFTGPLRFRDWITDPARRPYHLLHVARDLVISHLEIVEPSVDLDGVGYTTGALTGVLTFPSFRRQGWGGRLVGHAARLIEASDVDLGLICCEPHNADFYAAAAGWQRIPGARVVLGDTREQAEETSQVVFVRFLSVRAQQDRHRFDRCTLWLNADL